MLVAARRRWREGRRYAWRRSIRFELTLQDVRRLVDRVWPRDEGLALRRINLEQGFVRGNVELVPARGGRRRGPSEAKLRRRFQRLANRVDTAGRLDADDIALIYVGQEARCAVSGRFLRPDARIGDPDAMALIVIDRGRPLSRRNAVLVTACAAAVAERWGLERLEALARDVVEAGRRRGSSRTRRSR